MIQFSEFLNQNLFNNLHATCLPGGGFSSGAGQGGGRPGEKGAGGVREAGEEGAGSGIPKVAGSGRKREKLRNIAQYFAIKKMQRGGSQVREAGGLNPLSPPPPLSKVRKLWMVPLSTSISICEFNPTEVSVLNCYDL